MRSSETSVSVMANEVVMWRGRVGSPPQAQRTVPPRRSEPVPEDDKRYTVPVSVDNIKKNIQHLHKRFWGEGGTSRMRKSNGRISCSWHVREP